MTRKFLTLRTASYLAVVPYGEIAGTGDYPGIPAVPAVLLKVHTDYTGLLYNYSTGQGSGDVYPEGPNGPYTHYVDPEAVGATDTDNPYGTHTTPRASVPSVSMRAMPKGSVVELHNCTMSGNYFTGTGTAEAPIFIRSIVGDEPVISGVWSIRGGSYFILEHLIWDLADANSSVFGIDANDSAVGYFALRNCEVRNFENVPSGSRAIVNIRSIDTDSGNEDTGTISNVLIKDCYFHNLGEGRTGGSADATAVFAGSGTSNIWILANEFYLIGGDGIQINADGSVEGQDVPHHIYIAGNTFHDTWENGVDLKMCEDVIISSNVAYDFGASYGTLAGPYTAPFRYGGGDDTPSGAQRNNVWTLFNEVYNCDGPDGVFNVWCFATEVYSTEMYFIGNIVHDCHDTADGDATAFGWSTADRVYALNNTIYNVDRGFAVAGQTPTSTHVDEQITIANNIIGDLHASTQSLYHINIHGIDASLARVVIRNNVWYDSGGAASFRVGRYAPTLSYTIYTYDQLAVAYPDWVTGSFHENPDHTNAATGDFTLAVGSPAIDAAYDHGAYTTFWSRYGLSIQQDYAGNSVPTSGRDIGAYEK